MVKAQFMLFKSFHLCFIHMLDMHPSLSYETWPEIFFLPFSWKYVCSIAAKLPFKLAIFDAKRIIKSIPRTIFFGLYYLKYYFRSLAQVHE